MLLIISDLHWVDETAGKHNLPGSVYSKFLERLRCIERFEERRRRITEVQVLFLGDIFDVVRSRLWFKRAGNVGAQVRPWGTLQGVMDHTHPDVLVKTRSILQRILDCQNVQEACKAFQDWKARLTAKGVPVTFSCVLGNHDRFLHTDAQARSMVIDALNLDHTQFPLTKTFEDYGVVAFHGHELDLFNFSLPAGGRYPFGRVAYGRPSIGEAITIDLVARIPHLLEYRLKAEGVARPQAILSKLENIDNIRPVAAIFDWLSTYGKVLHSSLPAILDQVMQKICREFSRLPFVNDWSRVVDQTWIPSSAGKLQRWGARLFDLDFDEYIGKIKSLESARNLLLAGTSSSDPTEEFDRVRNHEFFRALRHELAKLEDRKYLVYGHTHHPQIIPVYSDAKEERMLINTGTFRPRIYRAMTGGFVKMKTLSYAVFYNRNEEKHRRNMQQRFEFWEERLAED